MILYESVMKIMGKMARMARMRAPMFPIIPMFPIPASTTVHEKDGGNTASKTDKPAPAMPCLNRKLAHRGAGLVDRPRIMRHSLELADNAAIIEGQFSGIILQGENRSRMGFLSRFGLNSGHIRPFTSNKRPIMAYFIPYNLGVE
jgi:hypothetical protein